MPCQQQQEQQEQQQPRLGLRRKQGCCVSAQTSKEELTFIDGD